MIGASFLPARFRTSDEHAPPSYLNRKLSPFLESLSRRSCTHPIHTIVFILLLASTSYLRLLEGSLFEAIDTSDAGHAIDFAALTTASRQLRMGADTAWKWQVDDRGPSDIENEEDHSALVTLIFPKSLSHSSPPNAPSPEAISHSFGARKLPPTSNTFSPLSQDSSLAYSIPWQRASALLAGLGEIPGHPDSSSEERSWIAKASKTQNGSQRSFQRWAQNAWSEFVDLLKHAETLDITIMFLGYVSMHLTFVSLFMSMRRMGSNFWLATTTLFSSIFAFSFALAVTTQLGVPINMVLLSEGLPFLVVTVGFEKPIVLTKAVLSASLDSRQIDGKPYSRDSSPKTIQFAVQSAVRAKGFEIVRDYVVEIAILIAGAASGIQGGLRQFCFLAAWIMLFDCLLLFTFYTAILCVKLEISRIKRHVTVRRALEEEGVSRRVAENVASRDEWPRLEDDSGQPGERGSSVFGKKVAESSVPKFKVLLFGGFILLNAVNIFTIPFRTANKNAPAPTVSGIQGVLNSPPLDPFKVAESGLDVIHEEAAAKHQPTVVTILPPIKYELRSTFVDDSDAFDYDKILDSMGGKVIEGVLKSLEDPVLSKWIVVALTISLALNGYLFNAARWTVKDPQSLSLLTDGGLNVAEVTKEEKIRAREQESKMAENGHATEPSDHLKEPRSVGDQSPEFYDHIIKSGRASELEDDEILSLAVQGKIPGYALEKTLDNARLMSKLQSLTRAVKIRRGLVSQTPATARTTSRLDRSKLPYKDFNYENVHGACCENVIGYLPLPIGVAGPLVVDGQSFYLPMATTEGVLVASTNRGCKAINAGGGATTVLTGDGMTRGPCVGFDTLTRAGEAKNWLDSDEGQQVMRRAFNSTSRFARLQTMQTALAGTYLYIRFKTTTGDAMGMNMISKGVECALGVMREEGGFEDMNIISVSGNYCTDKKPAAINWIDGRGKSVVAEAIIPGNVVRKLLKSDVNALVELNTAKNLIGSAMAGSIGGFNAHAANLVAAMFLATGQDPAQVVESANCITVMKNLNGDLQISVSLPCIEVGTIGGGTVLEPQQAMLDLLGVRGAHPSNPGDNARRLARIIAAAVLAGELSLCSALAAGHLVRAHMAHNRSAVPTPRSGTPVSSAVAEIGKEMGCSAKEAERKSPRLGDKLGQGLTMTSAR